MHESIKANQHLRTRGYSLVSGSSVCGTDRESRHQASGIRAGRNPCWRQRI